LLQNVGVGRYRQSLGTEGERIAEGHLRSMGLRIVARRFRTAGGEIDLVALAPDGLVFVEVKTRVSRACGDGVEAVTLAKQRSLCHAARSFLARYAPGRAARFAVLQIHGPGPDARLSWFDHAFDAIGP
jgi:putative endonuclease